ncbi:hypothetical protein X798_02907 [Onchocerca flexuosa]|uniref:Uncharacterized protein n=1 Tax=Onchocerca flexuosa TaxID=387005 RepID=A0A238BXT2_9BILA|nr:hypothetical protein X798_02907 [Onchocerca flexuosa]
MNKLNQDYLIISYIYMIQKWSGRIQSSLKNTRSTWNICSANEDEMGSSNNDIYENADELELPAAKGLCRITLSQFCESSLGWPAVYYVTTNYGNNSNKH